MIRTAASKGAILAAAMLIAGTAFVNCNKVKDGNVADGDVGSVGLAVVLSPGVILNTVTYRISGNGITPITGSINVTGTTATVSLLVSGIPAGMGYLLELNGTSTDGMTTCMGSANFNVLAGQTTGVNVTLQCRGPGANGTGRVMVNGRFDNCPFVSSMSAAPLQTGIGGTIALTSAAVDLDGDPISVMWTATPAIGTFSPANTATSTFTCNAPGSTTLAVAVSDGVCGDSQSIVVTCSTGAGTGGAMGTGGAGTGGAGTGGMGTGGAGTGGMGTGGAGTGGMGTGGAGTGGAGTGGAGTGGMMGTGGVVGCQEFRSNVPACASCDTDNCTDPATIGCCFLTDPADQALCLAAAQCFGTQNCTGAGDPVVCWCGTNLTTCLNSPTAANGPCVAQVQAASKSTDPAVIKARFVDPNFPIGRAVNQTSCRGSFCSAECSIP